MSDPEQLEFAADANRAIYTRNSADSPRIHWEWVLAGRTHAGIIVVTDSRLGIGAQMRAIRAIDERLGESGMRDRSSSSAATPFKCAPGGRDRCRLL